MDICLPSASVCTARYWKSDIPGEGGRWMADAFTTTQALAGATQGPHLLGGSEGALRERLRGKSGRS